MTTRFIEIQGEGHIALSEVVGIRHHHKKGDQLGQTYLDLRDGRVVKTWYTPERIADMQQTIVQAHPGFWLLRGWLDDDTDEFFVQRDPVVAWRIEWYGTMPIGIEDEDGSSVSILYPDGRVVRPDDQYYANEDEWTKDEVERQLAQRVERREKAKQEKQKAADAKANRTQTTD